MAVKTDTLRLASLLSMVAQSSSTLWAICGFHQPSHLSLHGLCWYMKSGSPASTWVSQSICFYVPRCSYVLMGRCLPGHQLIAGDGTYPKNLLLCQLVQDVWTQHISPTTIRTPTNLQIYLKDRLSQVSIQWGYCMLWMMHTTLSITQLYKSPIRANETPYCQETPQPIGVSSHTTMEIYVLITMTHHFSNIFLVELWYEPCFVRLTNIPRLVSLHYVPTAVLETCHSDTLHCISRHKLATVF